MNVLLHDIPCAVRTLQRNRGCTTAALLTLGVPCSGASPARDHYATLAGSEPRIPGKRSIIGRNTALAGMMGRSVA
jgi:hypothetical protein